MPKSNSLVSKLISDPKFASCRHDYFTNVQQKAQKYTPFISASDKPQIHLNKDVMERFRSRCGSSTTTRRSTGRTSNSSGSRFRPWKRKLNEWRPWREQQARATRVSVNWSYWVLGTLPRETSMIMRAAR